MDRTISKELNIIDRGNGEQKWSAEKGVMTSADLDKIIEQSTDNGSALNAIPTPFARFHVVDEAFRRVYEEKSHPESPAGEAYTRIVSDCLDVYELLFNQNYHENNTSDDFEIEIREWTLDKEIERLKEQTPIFADAVSNYYRDEIGKEPLYFVILKSAGKEYLVGISSSMTGFITPPDLDKKNSKEKDYIGSYYKSMPTVRRMHRGAYFKDFILFDDRSVEFKNYMYKIFCSNVIDNRFEHIQSYIRAFSADRSIRNDFHLNLKRIDTIDNKELIINGIAIKKNESNDTLNFFTDNIIKLPYKISQDNFIVPNYINDSDNRDYDYLMPLSEIVLSIMKPSDIKVTYNESHKGTSSLTIKVTLQYHEKEYEKTYIQGGSTDTKKGSICDLNEISKINIDLGLFPNIKSPEDKENDYYKLMVACYDSNESNRQTDDSISCEFYRTKFEGEGCDSITEADKNTYDYGVCKKVTRSHQDNEGNGCNTIFYEIFDTSFDALVLSIDGDKSVIIPKWEKSQQTHKSYTYAIDFGTSNTYISRRENDTQTQPQQLTMSKPIMSFLHSPFGNKQLSPIDQWSENQDEKIISSFDSEFLPTFIDGKKYKFPLRTALCKLSRNTDKEKLFDNRNIAFCYEKKRLTGDNEILTDIKWADNGNEESDARIFISELLSIIKSDVLSKDGDLSQTKILWFRPLSFKTKMKNAYERIWSEECKDILGINDTQIKCITESEAPYYYFCKKNEFNDTNAVSIIDIGGGSTDIVYFKAGAPILANSVHFGCDVMWGNGHNGFDNAKENNIYKAYLDQIKFGSEELQAINNEMCLPESQYSTKDIINFWISNEKETKISDKLKSDYKPLFLYHYASIIYHMAKVYRNNGLSCPNAITFSGNGSKYIDSYMTNNKKLLEELTLIVLQDVFDNDINEIQIVLPEERKESTCYGGLYRPGNAAEPKTCFYIGYGNKEYEEIKEMNADYATTLRQGIVSEVEHFNKIYLEMLKMLIRKEELEIRANDIKKLLNDKIGATLDKVYNDEIRKDENNKYNDSLFFIPIVDQLFKLTSKQ